MGVHPAWRSPLPFDQSAGQHRCIPRAARPPALRRSSRVTDEHSFTLVHYRDLLQTAKRAGYTFALFEKPAEGRTIYLRHDVDNSIEDAATIAAIETELGIRSSF